MSDAGLVIPLYEVRQKIYPRSVAGTYARWRWFFVFATQLVFYGLAWLEWNGRQAVLFDLAARKFYIFGLVLWPQDFIYLAVLLVISALALFLFTAIAGRLWCGYACPQTVYTEIFMWIERRIEGDRPMRMRLDGARANLRKVALKVAKHGVWIALSLWTGFTFVGYFTPIRELATGIAHVSLGGWEAFWIAFYGLATYGNAGWMREQVCKYMCPYARFQSAMFDPDTLLVEYDTARGEPRGGRPRKTDPQALGLGSCVDCSICVQVCPVGMDIRKGLQYECIGCGACIDGCDEVMHKMDYAPGLIRYSTQNATKRGWGRREIAARILRPRVLVYSAILAAVTGAMAVSLWTRTPLKADVIRDRASLARQVEDDRIENVYRVQVMNLREQPVRVPIVLKPNDALARVEVLTDGAVDVAATTTATITVRVRAEPRHAKGSVPIEFAIGPVTEKSRFLIP